MSGRVVGFPHLGRGSCLGEIACMLRNDRFLRRKRPDIDLPGRVVGFPHLGRGKGAEK